MSDKEQNEEQARLAKARAFFAAEETMRKEDTTEAKKIKEEKGEIPRKEGESTGEWLVRRDEA